MSLMANGKTNVLLIDANEMVQIYFRDIFWIHGLESKYEFTAVSSVEKARQIIANPETRPAIIFMDFVLPEGKEAPKRGMESCLGFLREIKQSSELKNINIVLFSGHMDKVFQEKAKDLGAGFMGKEDSMPNDIVQFLEKKFSTAR